MSSDTVAVDREALAQWFHTRNVPGIIGEPHPLDYRYADALIASGILLDAAAVRHEHGERIAKEAVDKIQRYMATRGRMGGEYDEGVDAGLSTAAAILLGDDIACDPSPAPEAKP